MANTFTPDFQEIWSKVQQDQFFKMTVAAAITDVSAKSQMVNGDVFNKPYRSSNSVQAYTRGTSITIDSKTDVADALTVNKQFATGFYIDDMDLLQTNYDLVAEYAKDDSDLLNIAIDSDILGEYANATSSVDDGDIGGTDGNGITLSTSNVAQVFGVAREKLAKQNVAMNNLFAVLSPEVENILVQYGAGRDTSSGDTLQNNGFIGRFYGFDLFSSNNLSGSAVLYMATDPTNTNTITIDGVLFTAVSSIGSTEGNFLVGTNQDTSRAVLAAFINDPETTSSDQVALSDENAKRVARNWVAVNDNGADTLTVNCLGVGRLVVSQTLADAADIWTAATQIQHNLFGRKGATALVIQKNPMPKIKDVETKMGVNVLNAILYGIKTWNNSTKELVDVQVRSDAFSAGAANI